MLVACQNNKFNVLEMASDDSEQKYYVPLSLMATVYSKWFRILKNTYLLISYQIAMNKIVNKYEKKLTCQTFCTEACMNTVLINKT
jgi:hypothetical protein